MLKRGLLIFLIIFFSSYTYAMEQMDESTLKNETAQIAVASDGAAAASSLGPVFTPAPEVINVVDLLLPYYDPVDHAVYVEEFSDPVVILMKVNSDVSQLVFALF